MRRLFAGVVFAVLAGALSAPASAASSVTVTYVPVAGTTSTVGLTVGPDGALWFSNMNDAVFRLNADLSTTRFWVQGCPLGLVTGPDANLWFGEACASKLGYLTSSASTVDFPTGGSTPGALVVGSDGNIWATEYAGGFVVRMTPTGVVTRFSVGGGPGSLSVGADGRLWFAEYDASAIGRIDADGSNHVAFALPAGSRPSQTALGADGNIWFTERDGDRIGRITPSGAITEFSLPSGAQPSAIVAGPDGNLWFGETNAIGQITPDGVITELPVDMQGMSIGIMVVAADKTIWFTNPDHPTLGHITGIVDSPTTTTTQPTTTTTQPTTTIVPAGPTSSGGATPVRGTPSFTG